MILVDSSVWIDYLNDLDTPQTLKLDEILNVERVGVGDLIMAEVLQGAPTPKYFNATVNIFSRLDFVTLGGHKVAIEAARNYIRLRALGFTVRKTIDSIIATRCIISGFQLLHNDHDFIPFEKHLGLKSVI